MKTFDVLLRLRSVDDRYDAEMVKDEVEDALYDGGFSYGPKVMGCVYSVTVRGTWLDRFVSLKAQPVRELSQDEWKVLTHDLIMFFAVATTVIVVIAFLLGWLLGAA